MSIIKRIRSARRRAIKQGYEPYCILLTYEDRHAVAEELANMDPPWSEALLPEYAADSMREFLDPPILFGMPVQQMNRSCILARDATVPVFGRGMPPFSLREPIEIPLSSPEGEEALAGHAD